MFAVDAVRHILIYYYSSGCFAWEDQRFQKCPNSLERILAQNKFGHIVEFI